MPDDLRPWWAISDPNHPTNLGAAPAPAAEPAPPVVEAAPEPTPPEAGTVQGHMAPEALAALQAEEDARHAAAMAELAMQAENDAAPPAEPA